MRALEAKLLAMQSDASRMMDDKVAAMQTRFEGTFTMLMQSAQEQQARQNDQFMAQMQAFMARFAPAASH